MKILLSLCALLLFTVTARGNDIYFAATALGAGNGMDCADAYAYNDGTHGVNVAANWVPGNRLILCSSFTLAANTNVVTAQASGANGSPITVVLTGATITEPYLPGDPVNGCSSNCGAIDTNNKNYITIDGGGTGVIQATANGSSLANQAHTMGVDLRGDHLMLKGMTIRNLYIVSPSEANVPNPPGFYSTDVLAGGGPNIEICNNILNNAHIGVDSSAVSTSFVAAPTSLCTSNQANPGVNIYNNTTVDHGWQIHVGGNGYVNVYNNDMSDWLRWFNPLGANSYHLDGVIVFPGAPGVTHAYVYNNYIHGDFASSPTGFVFCTYGVTGSGSSCTIFNNLLVGTGGTATAAYGMFFHAANGNPLGPHLIYNNTMSGFGGGQIYTEGDTTQHYTVRNNVFQSNGGYYMNINGTPPANYVSNNNIYNGARTICGFPCGFAGGKTLAQWQALGEDPNSTEQNINLSSSFFPLAGSPALGAGVNLTAVGVIPLNTSAPVTPGSSYSCGAGCRARPASGNWDLGHTYQSTTLSPPLPPTGVTTTPH